MTTNGNASARSQGQSDPSRDVGEFSETRATGRDTVSYRLIRYEEDAPIARIVLDNPEKMNPLSNALRDELEHALEDAGADEATRVVIISGSGRAFSGGYDLTPNDAPDFDDPSLHRKIQKIKHSGLRWLRAIWEFPKPVVAQVHGYCMAGANDLAGVCDITVAAEDAIFSVNESRVLGTNHLLGLWPLLIGMKKTKELFFTGGYVTGKEAAELGMVNRAVPFEDLERETDLLARRIAMSPDELLFSIKQGVNRWYEIMGLEAMVRATTEWDALGSQNPKLAEWAERVQSGGVRAALDWRDKPYGDRPFPFTPKSDVDSGGDDEA